MKRYKGVKLNIFYKPMADLMDMLRLREVDFVLCLQAVDAGRQYRIPRFIPELSCRNRSDSHPLASKGSISLDELARYNLALPSKGLQARNALEKILERYPHDLDIRIELNDPNILLNLIRNSNLVTVLAEASVHNQPGVRAIPLDLPENEMTGCVNTLAGSYHKKSICEFVKLLSESVAVKERGKRMAIVKS